MARPTVIIATTSEAMSLALGTTLKEKCSQLGLRLHSCPEIQSDLANPSRLKSASDRTGSSAYSSAEELFEVLTSKDPMELAESLLILDLGTELERAFDIQAPKKQASGWYTSEQYRTGVAVELLLRFPQVFPVFLSPAFPTEQSEEKRDGWMGFERFKDALHIRQTNDVIDEKTDFIDIDKPVHLNLNLHFISPFSGADGFDNVLKHFTNGMRCWFDPTGLRTLVKNRFIGTIFGNQDCWQNSEDARKILLNRLSMFAITIDEEREFALLNAYGAYKYGRRVHIINTYEEFKSPDIWNAKDDHSNTLILRDIDLRFPDVEPQGSAGMREDLKNVAGKAWGKKLLDEWCVKLLEASCKQISENWDVQHLEQWCDKLSEEWNKKQQEEWSKKLLQDWTKKLQWDWTREQSKECPKKLLEEWSRKLQVEWSKKLLQEWDRRLTQAKDAEEDPISTARLPMVRVVSSYEKGEINPDEHKKDGWNDLTLRLGQRGDVLVGLRKPIGTIYDLVQLFPEHDPQSTIAWLMQPKDNPVTNSGGHGAPYLNLAIAESLLISAKRCNNNPTANIIGAFLAGEAYELLLCMSKTTALEALLLVHKKEASAEVEFPGVAHEIKIERRRTDIEQTLKAFCPDPFENRDSKVTFQNSTTQSRMIQTSNIFLSQFWSELRVIYRQGEQFNTADEANLESLIHSKWIGIRKWLSTQIDQLVANDCYELINLEKMCPGFIYRSKTVLNIVKKGILLPATSLRCWLATSVGVIFLCFNLFLLYGHFWLSKAFDLDKVLDFFFQVAIASITLNHVEALGNTQIVKDTTLLFISVFHMTSAYLLFGLLISMFYRKITRS